MQMKRERWFNYRPLCLVFIMLLIGSIFSFYCFFAWQCGDKTLNILLAVGLILVCLAVSIIFAVRNKSLKLFLIPAISFLIGVGIFGLSLATFNNKNFVEPTTIDARIYLVKSNDKNKTVYADNLYFDGIKTSGKIVIYLTDYSYAFENVEVGKQIHFTPNSVKQIDLLKGDTPNAYYFKNNIKYQVSANITNFEFGNTKFTFAEIVRLRIKKALSFGLSNENTELTYSALFGDKTTLSNTSIETFKLAGVAHLLAVSGLHVGIVVGLFNWICKKLKLKNWIKLTIIGVLLVLYVYLCNFSTSIVRAAIMAMVMLLAPVFHRKYDSLSAIGLAGIVCFLLNPLFAFDASALMSFACVTGICLLNMSFTKMLDKAKMKNVVSESLAISASTMVALLLIMAYFFKTINLISIISNIILIPLFSIGFMIVFVVGFFGLITPYIGYLLYPLNYLFDFIGLIARVLGNLPFANFATTSVHYFAVVIYMALLLIMSRITVSKHKHKLAVILPIVAILIAFML